MPDPTDGVDLSRMTARLVSAYVAGNAVPAAELPALIAAVAGALSRTATGVPVVPEPAPKPTPAVPVRRSVTPDHLISLEDGRKYRTLKRHLAGLGLTPDQYRRKWSLAPDYPMVAPSYARQRSEMAKSLGLGRKAGR